MLNTTFDNISAWNPWILKAESKAAVGEIVTVEVVLGKRTMTVQHKILDMEPNRLFRWCDLGWFAAVACGRRCRTMEPLPGGSTRYINELPITGPLAWLADMFTGKQVQAGMAMENEALKQYVETVAKRA